MRLDREAFARGLWPEALVAALATLAVAWPLTELLRDNSWILPAVALVGVVAVAGALLRTVDAPPSMVSLSQLLAAVYGTLLMHVRETMIAGFIPTPATLDRAGELLRQAGTVLRTYAAPAPTTTGVAFLVVSVIALTAVSVDAMGVTGRAPAAAGIPLAAAFLVSVSNNGEAMKPWYFVAVAAAWLLMLAQQGHRLTMAWPSSGRPEMTGGQDITLGARGHGGRAQSVGALALLAAVLGAAALPHLPPTFFSDGLAENPDARTQEGAGQVEFTETMDPSKDLRNQSQAPVLTYRTDATALEPLRVTATSVWRDGRWIAPERDEEELERRDGDLPAEEGLLDSVETATQEIEVTGNALGAPHVASPGYPAHLEVEVPWRWSPTDSTILVDEPAESYTVTYRSLARAKQLPDGIGGETDARQFDPSLLEVDQASADVVGELADRVTDGADNTLEAAVAIQDHLRSSAYRYSLDLAPSARADAADPIGGFLETKQGYCVQFATAMVMMARHEGIPARMAVGFLPGRTQSEGTRAVRAADAHTWPELWIDGLGWTRFEPTPGIHAGDPPSYADNEDEESASVTTTPAEPQQAEPTPTQTPVAPKEPTFADHLADLLPVLGRTLAVILLVGLLGALVPWAGRRYREAGLRGAQDATDKVEGQWMLLTRSLDDLGVGEPPSRSPKEMAGHYRRATRLDAEGEEALGRVAATLERSRYAPPTALAEDEVDTMGEDVRALVGTVRARLPLNVRLNASLAPRSGFRAIGEAWRRLLRR